MYLFNELMLQASLIAKTNKYLGEILLNTLECCAMRSAFPLILARINLNAVESELGDT